MTALPFGASRANPPAPRGKTPPTSGARAASPASVVADPAARADAVDRAWDSVTDPRSTDEDVRAACRVVIANCADTRRDRAADILALFDGER